jgi:hypothetical protein
MKLGVKTIQEHQNRLIEQILKRRKMVFDRLAKESPRSDHLDGIYNRITGYY